MPGCAAVGCSNSAKKGFLMKAFPRDPARRKEWATRMKRDNWTPTNRSVLCEAHFEESMWEKTREDGSRRLKLSAVPTIFSFSKPKRLRKPPKVRHIETEKEPVSSTSIRSPEQRTSLPPCSDKQMESSFSSETSEEISLNGNMECSNIDVLRVERLKLIEENKQLQQNFRVLINRFLNTERQKKMLEEKLERFSVQNMEEENLKLLCGVFNSDHIYAMKHSVKFTELSKCTIKKALLLKFACGNNGYKELLAQNIPLPSLQTLCQRLQHLKFQSGILDEIFEFLKWKVSKFGEHEMECGLVLDEIAITSSNMHDPSTNKYIGKVTLPGHNGNATKALVIMLVGIGSWWKQTVAYYFTGSSVDGRVYSDILFQIIGRSEKLGLKISSIISDMNSSNQALWKMWNIVAGRFSRVNNCIQHPLDPKRKIFIVADVPHIFKNMKNMLINNQVIYISESVQERFGLPTNAVMLQHIHELIQYQSNYQFLLAPKLSESDLMPDYFDKMKVHTSINVISHDVSSALQFLSEQLNKKQYLTTAWYVDLINKWFTLMTSRHASLALSKLNLDSYNDAIKFLEDFMNTIQNLYIGKKKSWKPSQSGALISTKSILDLQNTFLNLKGFSYFLTGRFTQDCLENLFSTIHDKHEKPNSLQFENNLKLIAVSQYMKDTSKGSYDKDDRESLCEFLSTIKAMGKNLNTLH